MDFSHSPALMRLCTTSLALLCVVLGTPAAADRAQRSHLRASYVEQLRNQTPTPPPTTTQPTGTKTAKGVANALGSRNTLIVDSDRGPFRYIEDAIDAAEDGDTISIVGRRKPYDETILIQEPPQFNHRGEGHFDAGDQW